MTSVNDYNRPIIEEFRANRGKLGGNFDGATMLLLTTKGAKTGRLHTTPVAYLPDGDGANARVVVFASKAGADNNPAWYHNLRANPIVTVEVGDETYEARAIVTEGAERDRLWETQKTRMPGFADYERKTSRVIPVIALERVS